MKLEQQQQAQTLYFQTDLSKSEIAGSVGISRRSLHYWIRQNHWDRIRKSAEFIPSFLAENCYQLIGHLTESILSEDRIGKPVTSQEASAIYKLTLTIGKLKNRGTLNENMETFGWFLDNLSKNNPELAGEIQHHISHYISSRAAIDASQYVPPKCNESGYIPIPKANTAEQQLDLDDFVAWMEEKARQEKEQAPAIEEAPGAPVTPDPEPVIAENSASIIANPEPVTTDNSNAAIAQPETSPAVTGAPQNQKTDLRKLLRGTASAGPCKNLPRYKVAAA